MDKESTESNISNLTAQKNVAVSENPVTKKCYMYFSSNPMMYQPIPISTKEQKPDSVYALNQ